MMKGMACSASSFSAMVSGSHISKLLESAVKYSGEFFDICTALTPMILAFSYLVRNGEVILFSFG